MESGSEREFVQSLALPGLAEPGEEDVLAVLAGCGWIERNTRFRFGGELPAGVRLFLLKYREMMDSGAAFGVKSERLAGMSQAGMSQSFAERVGLEDLARQMAAQTLGEWYDPVAVLGAERKYL